MPYMCVRFAAEYKTSQIAVFNLGASQWAVPVNRIRLNLAAG
jgi:hypothetical protein